MAVACGGKTPQSGPRNWNDPTASTAKGPPFVTPGERVTYRVTAHNVELASFVLAVGTETTALAGKPAIAVQAGAQSAGIAALVKKVRVEFTAWIDVTSGQSLLFQVNESAGKGDDTVETVEARFTQLAGGKFPVSLARPDAPEKIEQQTIVGVPTDLLTLLMTLRAWDGKTGEKRAYDAVRNRYVWRTQLTLAARENVVTELGEFPTVRFDAASRRINRDGSFDVSIGPRKYSVWISDDADRVPVKLVAQSDYGDIEMAIVDYAEGSAPNLARPTTK